MDMKAEFFDMMIEIFKKEDNIELRINSYVDVVFLFGDVYHQIEKLGLHVLLLQLLLQAGVLAFQQPHLLPQL